MVYRRLFIIGSFLFLNMAYGASLHDAIRLGETEELNMLASHKKYLNEQDEKGNAPAHIAVMTGKLNELKFLKKKGADFELKNRIRDNLLHTAIRYKSSPEMFKWLLVHEFLLEDKNHAGDSPLTLAIKEGDLSKVKALVKRGASPNSVNGEGVTAFLVAVLLGDADIISALLQSSTQIDFEAEDLEGRSPIGVAVAQGNLGMAMRFFSHGADMEFVNIFGQTLLHLSAAHDHGESNGDMTQFLLDEGKIPVDAQDLDGNTAFLLAAARGDIKDVTALVESGADPHKTNIKGENALHLIKDKSEKGKRVAQKVIQLGLDTESTDNSGNTSIHHFTKELNFELLEYFLVELKVRGDLKNNNGRTALDLLNMRRTLTERAERRKKITELFQKYIEDDDFQGCSDAFKTSV